MNTRTTQCVLGAIILASALTASAALNAANLTTSESGTKDSTLQPDAELTGKFTAFAGSTQNAQALVDGLRSGTPIALTDSGGTSTTITPTTKAMGFGNIDIALSLARQ